MNDVAIVGTGQTKFSKDDGDVEKLLFESTKNCIQSVRNCEPKDIEGVLVSTNNNSKYLGAILSETMGIQPKISHSIEHLCSSGTNALISGYAYISSGLADIILISGVESATNPGQVLEWDKSRGNFEHPIYWASMLTKAHKRRFQTTEEELAIGRHERGSTIVEGKPSTLNFPSFEKGWNLLNQYGSIDSNDLPRGVTVQQFLVRTLMSDVLIYNESTKTLQLK